MSKASRSRGNVATWNVTPLSRMGNTEDMFMYFPSVLTPLNAESSEIQIIGKISSRPFLFQFQFSISIAQKRNKFVRIC